jgi:hypothetical protein
MRRRTFVATAAGTTALIASGLSLTPRSAGAQVTTPRYGGCDALVCASLELMVESRGDGYLSTYHGTLTLREPWTGASAPRLQSGSVGFDASCCTSSLFDLRYYDVLQQFDANGVARVAMLQPGLPAPGRLTALASISGLVVDDGPATGWRRFDASLTLVPDPATLALTALGILGGLATRRRA